VDVRGRAKLLARLEREAKAFQNADHQVRQMCYGRCLGLLSAGVELGYWSGSVSGKASDAIYHGMPRRKLRAMLSCP